MPGNTMLVIARSLNPASRGACVGHRFQRGKRFAGDNEKCAAWIQSGQCAGQVGAVQIGNKMYAQIGELVGRECVYGHAWAKIRTADTDIDDIGNAIPGKSPPFAIVDLLTKISHALQASLHFRRSSIAGAQVGVPDSTPFGVIDDLAGAHPGHPVTPSSLFCQLAQERHGWLDEALLGEVEKDLFVAE